MELEELEAAYAAASGQRSQLISDLAAGGAELARLRDIPAGERLDGWEAEVAAATRDIEAADIAVSALSTLARQLGEDLERARRSGATDPEAALGDERRPSGLRTFGELIVESGLFEDFRVGDAGRRMELPLGADLSRAMTAQTRNLLQTQGGPDFGTSADPQAWLWNPTAPVEGPKLGAFRFDLWDAVTKVPTAFGGNHTYMQEVNGMQNMVGWDPGNESTAPSHPMDWINGVPPEYADSYGGAKFVPEGGMKPEVSIEFRQLTARIQKIAAWIKITEEELEDTAGLVAYVNSWLVNAIRARAQWAILWGQGETVGQVAQPVGLYNAEGVHRLDLTTTPASVIGDNFMTITRALECADACSDSDSPVVGFVNCTDFWAMVGRRNAAGQFDVDPTQAPAQMAWGRPITTLPGYLLPGFRPTASPGGFRPGLSVFGSFADIEVMVRKDVAVVLLTSVNDDELTNCARVLAEARMGIKHRRPSGFCFAEMHTEAE